MLNYYSIQKIKLHLLNCISYLNAQLNGKDMVWTELPVKVNETKQKRNKNDQLAQFWVIVFPLNMVSFFRFWALKRVSIFEFLLINRVKVQAGTFAAHTYPKLSGVPTPPHTPRRGIEMAMNPSKVICSMMFLFAFFGLFRAQNK